MTQPASAPSSSATVAIRKSRGLLVAITLGLLCPDAMAYLAEQWLANAPDWLLASWSAAMFALMLFAGIASLLAFSRLVIALVRRPPVRVEIYYSIASVILGSIYLALVVVYPLWWITRMR